MPDFLPSNLPNDSEFILVTDELGSPADFILHKALSTRLRSQSHAQTQNPPSSLGPVLIVSSSNDGSIESSQGGKWRSIAAKSGINTSQHISNGSLRFIDTLPTSSSLKLTYAEISKHIHDNSENNNGSGKSTLVIVDDISSLIWLGASEPGYVLDLTRFIRALVSLCRTSSSQLIIRQHLLSSPSSTSLPSSHHSSGHITAHEAHFGGEEAADDQIFRVMFQLCASHIQVCRLSSGRSGSVSGQIAVHPGPISLGLENKRGIRKSSAVQYCLADFGVSFFERGMGAAVL